MRRFENGIWQKSRKGKRRDARKMIHGLKFDMVPGDYHKIGVGICEGCYAEKGGGWEADEVLCDAINRKYEPCYQNVDGEGMAVFKLKGGD